MKHRIGLLALLWLVSSFAQSCYFKNQGKIELTQDGSLSDDGSSGKADSRADNFSLDHLGPDFLADLLPDRAESDWSEIKDGTPDFETESKQELAVQDNEVPDISPDTKPGDENCYHAIQCIMFLGCAPSDQKCWDKCSQELAPAAEAEFGQVAACVSTKCQQSDDYGKCLWEDCSLEMVQCIGGDGDATCFEVYTCMQGCGTDDGLCFIECVSASSQAGLDRMIAMSAPDATQQEKTLAAIECFGGNGNADCGTTMVCLGGCQDDPESDPMCMANCMAMSSPEAKQTLLQLFSCGPDPCIDVMAICLGGKGVASCKETLACFDGCKGDLEPQSCNFQCLADSSPEAVGQLVKMWKCINEKCGDAEMCPLGMVCLALCSN